MENIIIESSVDIMNIIESGTDIKEDHIITNIVESIIESTPICKRLKSSIVRQHLFEDFGDVVFLDPINLKYPIINPDNPYYEGDEILFDCNLLISSYCDLLKTPNSNTTMIDRAKSLLSECKCPQISIKFKNIEESIDLETLLYYLR